MRDNEVKSGLAAAGIYCQSFNADTLREPWEVLDARGKVRPAGLGRSSAGLQARLGDRRAGPGRRVLCTL